jgi:hypothetical protein
MAEDAIELLTHALRLPPAARAAVADSLIESLDTEVDENAEEAWRARSPSGFGNLILVLFKRSLGTRSVVTSVRD